MMEGHILEMQSTLEPVNLSDSASSKCLDKEKSDKSSGMKDCSNADYSGDDAAVLEKESRLLPLDHDSTAVDIGSTGALGGRQDQPCGEADGCSHSCSERKVESSTKPEHLSSEEFERQDVKTNQTEQSLMEILEELSKDSDLVKKKGDKIYSESPYDTDYTKKLISTMRETSSQEDLLKDIESELLSTDFPKEGKFPNGVQKGEHALALFEKCVRDKYLEQEQTMKM